MKRRFSFLLACCLGLCLMGSQLRASELHLDLTGSSYAASGQERFKIYHLQAPGVEGKYTVEFQWNPATLNFVPVGLELEQGYITLTASELASFLSQGGDFALLDVRITDEFNSGHIPGAVNDFRYDGVAGFDRQTLDAVAARYGKDHMIIVYCGGVG